MLGKTEGRMRRGRQRIRWLGGVSIVMEKLEQKRIQHRIGVKVARVQALVA